MDLYESTAFCTRLCNPLPRAANAARLNHNSDYSMNYNINVAITIASRF